jgi:hypothetical protein
VHSGVAGVRQIVETAYEKVHHAFGLGRERPHELTGFQVRVAAKRRCSTSVAGSMSSSAGQAFFADLVDREHDPISHQAFKYSDPDTDPITMSLPSQCSQPQGLKHGFGLEERSCFCLISFHQELLRGMRIGPSKEGCAYATDDFRS